MDAAGAERLGGQRCSERGVDAARYADDDVAKPVLLDVIAKAELERESHLIELGERRRDRAGRRLCEVDYEQRLLEARRPRDDASLPIEHE